MLIGIDEVGRGALAGPLVIACVSLKKGVDGLKDSKKLSKNQRTYLSQQIYQASSLCTFGWVWPHEIDRLGLTKAMTLAILRGLRNINFNKDTQIILDGNQNYLQDYEYNVKTIIKADNSVKEVSAASIVAKVIRDSYMVNMDNYYPLYNFKSNVGYGTKDHLKAILDIGPSNLHRKLFLKKII